MHRGFFNDDRIRRNRFIERLAQPTGINGRIAAVLYGFTLKNGHLLIMFFRDLLESFLIFRLLATKPSDALSLSSSRARVTAGGAIKAKSTLYPQKGSRE